MYGKGLSRRKHNPDRNAKHIGIVCFWKIDYQRSKAEQAVKQIPKCLYSFYVPNPINYSNNGNNGKMYLLEGEGQNEFYFFNEDAEETPDNENEDDEENQKHDKKMSRKTCLQVCNYSSKTEYYQDNPKETEHEKLESKQTCMSTWCTRYVIPAEDSLYKEIKRTKNVFEKGLFGTKRQLNFAPKLFTFAESEDEKYTDLDRVLVYSVPTEEDGQTVSFFICKLERTVLTIKNVSAVINLVRVDKSNNFVVTLLHKDQIIQGQIVLPTDSDKEGFQIDDLDFYQTLIYDDEKKEMFGEQALEVNTRKRTTLIDTKNINNSFDDGSDELSKIVKNQPKHVKDAFKKMRKMMTKNNQKTPTQPSA